MSYGKNERNVSAEHQIIAILKAVEAGRTVKDVCREREISDATYYQWKSKYGGMEAADIKRLRELEEENRRFWRNDLRNAAILVGQSQVSRDLPQAFLWNMIALETLLTQQGDTYMDALPTRAEAFFR